VTGVVDGANNILLSGNLADGTYTLRYVYEDGTYSDPVILEVGTIVTYTITQNLISVTSDNSATEVRGGESLIVNLTANDGYNLSVVTVTMGGTDITSAAVSSGTINIAEVTGNIVITAVAEEVQTGGYTNHANPNDSYWKDGYRLSIGSGGTNACEGHIVTNFIPAKADDILRVKGMSITDTLNSQYAKIVAYSAKDDESSKVTGLFGMVVQNPTQSNTNYGKNVTVNGDISECKILYDDTGVQRATSDVAYIRIDGILLDGYTTNDVIITINEEIA